MGMGSVRAHALTRMHVKFTRVVIFKRRSGVIGGLEFTCTDHEEKQNKCVANMSLGGGLYNALNEAVEAVVACGCPVVVAAGNGASDACDGSPSSSAGTCVELCPVQPQCVRRRTPSFVLSRAPPIPDCFALRGTAPLMGAGGALVQPMPTCSFPVYLLPCWYNYRSCLVAC